MSDKILRAIARNAGIQISAASTTGIVERAREIHNTTPLATAALGRTLTITSIMGSQLKVEDGSVTVQIKGNGPLGTIVCVGESDGCVRGYLQDPAADLPLRPDGKLNVGGGVGRGYLMVIKDIGLKDPVTGTVALVDGEIAEDLTRYFAESEQIPSACALGVLVDTDCTVKCAGGWLVQLMPGVKDADIDQSCKARADDGHARQGHEPRGDHLRRARRLRSGLPPDRGDRLPLRMQQGKGRARADQPRKDRAFQDDRRTGEK